MEIDVKRELENKYKNIPDYIINDSIKFANKNSKNVKLTYLTLAKRYIERYIVNELEKDNFDIELSTIENFSYVKHALKKISGVDSTNLNKIYEDAILKIYENYDYDKDFSMNVIYKVREILLEQQNPSDSKKLKYGGK
jgi:hypothetical protein